jgi:DNA-binding CsgD family transcriptional regulator
MDQMNAMARSSGRTSAPPKSQRPQLSRREREIVTLLVAGRSAKEAAATLGLSPRTVETYLERLKRRFGQPRLLALIVYLVRQGIIE